MASYRHPAWSPDGRRVAFTGIRTPGGPRRLIVVDVDTGEEEGFFTDPFPTNPRQPRWSPSEPDVLVLTAVPELIVVDAIPAFAVASVAEASDDDQLFRVTLFEESGSIGGDTRLLTDNGGFDPTWRRDGQRVVFASLRPADTTADLFELAADADAGLEVEPRPPHHQPRRGGGAHRAGRRRARAAGRHVIPPRENRACHGC